MLARTTKITRNQVNIYHLIYLSSTRRGVCDVVNAAEVCLLTVFKAESRN
jgi:hypothetical protein